MTMKPDEGAGYDLRDEIIMITGASRGLGAELTRAFAAAGARVFACARGAVALDGLAVSMAERSLAVHTTPLDVTDQAAVRRWTEQVTRLAGAPTVLINNASLLGKRGPLLEQPLDQWRAVVEANLTGGFIAIREAVPHMVRAGRGSVIQLSSGAAVIPRTEWGAYSVSKVAADAMAMNLAAELRDTGVRVNVVDPGAMRTGMRASAYPGEDPATLDTPAARAEIFLWLASEASEGVSGQRFRATEFRGRDEQSPRS
jgi:NAD(P)-dependent dehydrogenase (short-subunit alcohol dehydrogenase family)